MKYITVFYHSFKDVCINTCMGDTDLSNEGIEGIQSTGIGYIFVMILFRGRRPLSSSQNIFELVPVCWLLFQCF